MSMRTHEYEGAGFCTAPIDGVPCLKDRADNWHVQLFRTNLPHEIAQTPFIVQQYEPDMDDGWWDHSSYHNGLLAAQACDNLRQSEPSSQFRVIKLVLGDPEENYL